jgi:hypothetical protein
MKIPPVEDELFHENSSSGRRVVSQKFLQWETSCFVKIPPVEDELFHENPPVGDESFHKNSSSGRRVVS